MPEQASGEHQGRSRALSLLADRLEEIDIAVKARLEIEKDGTPLRKLSSQVSAAADSQSDLR